MKSSYTQANVRVMSNTLYTGIELTQFLIIREGWEGGGGRMG